MTSSIAPIRWKQPWFFLLLLLLPSSALGETIVDDANGFTLKLPEGFVANAELKKAAPNIIHAFVLGDSSDDELDIMLIIERLRGTLGRERLSDKDFPPGFKGRRFSAKWQGMDVDAFSVPEELGDLKTVTYNVQIPLKKAAIQIKLFGAVDRDKELTALRTEILQGLKGESNWNLASELNAAIAAESKAKQAGGNSTSNRLGAISNSNAYGYVLLVVAIVIVVGGLVGLFFISKIAPKGTVLGLSVLMYAISWGFGSSIQSRELMLVSGSLRMLGFAGGILGIFELASKKHKKQKPNLVDRKRQAAAENVQFITEEPQAVAQQPPVLRERPQVVAEKPPVVAEKKTSPPPRKRPTV